MSHWDLEYQRRGIPSSSRVEPSTTVHWALANWHYITGQKLPSTALDVGTGTGRNAAYMSSLGIHVTAFDCSSVAIDIARSRFPLIVQNGSLSFELRDLTQGLPGNSDCYDLISDIFVYKHQMLASDRLAYRKEVRRTLRDNGRLLLSLAHVNDGYYSTCPRISSGVLEIAVLDPIAGIGSILFSLDSLCVEMSDFFELEISWFKIKEGIMHNKLYLRHTLATIWKPII